MPKIKTLRAVAASGVHIPAGTVAEVSDADARILTAMGCAGPADDGNPAPEPAPEEIPGNMPLVGEDRPKRRIGR